MGKVRITALLRLLQILFMLQLRLLIQYNLSLYIDNVEVLSISSLLDLKAFKLTALSEVFVWSGCG